MKQNQTKARSILICVLLGLSMMLIILPCCVCAEDNEDDEWQLLWSDHFDDDNDGLNPSYWTKVVGFLGFNAEFQTYTDRPDNVKVQDGKLHLTAIRDFTAQVGYTSGRVNTLDKVMVKYGMVEASIKIPDMKKGLWPAFWTLGENYPEVGWPAAGELDILEAGQKLGSSQGLGNHRIVQAFHWDAYGEYVVEDAHIDMPVDLSQDFYTYKMIWQPDFIETFVDDYLVYKLRIDYCFHLWDCSELHQFHFLILNLAVAGLFTCCEFGFELNDYPNGTAWTMEVDYVKIYGNEHTEIIMPKEPLELVANTTTTTTPAAPVESSTAGASPAPTLATTSTTPAVIPTTTQPSIPQLQGATVVPTDAPSTGSPLAVSSSVEPTMALTPPENATTSSPTHMPSSPPTPTLVPNITSPSLSSVGIVNTSAPPGSNNNITTSTQSPTASGAETSPQEQGVPDEENVVSGNTATNLTATMSVVPTATPTTTTGSTTSQPETTNFPTAAMIVSRPGNVVQPPTPAEATTTASPATIIPATILPTSVATSVQQDGNPPATETAPTVASIEIGTPTTTIGKLPETDAPSSSPSTQMPSATSLPVAAPNNSSTSVTTGPSSFMPSSNDNVTNLNPLSVSTAAPSIGNTAAPQAETITATMDQSEDTLGLLQDLLLSSGENNNDQVVTSTGAPTQSATDDADADDGDDNNTSNSNVVDSITTTTTKTLSPTESPAFSSGETSTTTEVSRTSNDENMRNPQGGAADASSSTASPTTKDDSQKEEEEQPELIQESDSDETQQSQQQTEAQGLQSFALSVETCCSWWSSFLVFAVVVVLVAV